MHKKIVAVITVTLLIAGGIWGYVNYQATSLLDKILEELVADGNFRRLEYETLRVKINGDIALENLTVEDTSGNTYILQTILVRDIDYGNAVPHHLQITVSGLTLPDGIPRYGTTGNSAADYFLASIVDDDRIALVIDYRYRYSPEDDFQLDSSIDIGLENAFSMRAFSVLRNIPLEHMNQTPLGPSANPGIITTTMLDGEIPQASMSLEDLGAVDSYLSIQAELRGLSRDAYRQQLSADLETMHLLVPMQLRSLARDLTADLITFLEGNRTLSISIRPEYQGNIRQLQTQIMSAIFIGDFERAIDLLNLEIETR